ncbi:MAG: glutathione S-transferase family protein [Rhodoferax sp.]|nr:glutathione S-transferase family protein [Rhodoferax sp.]
MNTEFTLYGWHLSYFTGKVLCYLRYKKVPFVLDPVNILTLMHRIKRETGEVVMPVLRTPHGEWIQDSSAIIDYIEAKYPTPSTIPDAPVPRFCAYLLEAWCDEWWVPIGMHTRWTYPENYAVFEREAGAALLPHFPRFLQNMAVRRVANTLRGALDRMGIRAPQYAVMDAWTQHMLDLLDAHFAQSAYLLGERPSLADFALAGPMYGHLGRDPWPARELVAPRKQLRAWLDRISNPMPASPAPTLGLSQSPDQIPTTLEPVLRAVFREFVPLFAQIGAQVEAILPTVPTGTPLRRFLQDVDVPMGDGRFRRAAMPYTLWMAQRVLDVYAAMNVDDQARVRAWAEPLGGGALLDLTLPRMRRSGLRVSG